MLAPAKLFTRKAFKIIDTLTQYSEMAPLQIRSKSIRAVVLPKQNTLFYRVTDTQFIVIDLFGNRQSPEKKIL